MTHFKHVYQYLFDFIPVCCILYTFLTYYVWLNVHSIFIILDSRLWHHLSFLSIKKFLLGIPPKAAGIPLFLCLVIFHAFQFLKSIVLLEIHVIDSFKIFFFCFNFCLFYVIVTFTSQNLLSSWIWPCLKWMLPCPLVWWACAIKGRYSRKRNMVIK